MIFNRTFLLTSLLLLSAGGALAQNIPGFSKASSDKNYIATHQTLVEGVTDVTNPSITKNDVRQSVQYYDGLGRLIQTVNAYGASGSSDIVSAVDYDKFGRQTKGYLPYAASLGAGQFNNDALVQQLAYYQKGGEIASDPAPFSSIIYESSPKNVVIKRGFVGSSWQPNGVNTYDSDDRTIKYLAEAVSEGEVLLWSFSYPSTDFPFGFANAGTTDGLQFYHSTDLFRFRTKDEQGHETVEYIDKKGRTVLIRKQAAEKSGVLNDTNYASTYSIYNDLGQLVLVLPPEAASRLQSEYFPSSVTDTDREAFLNRWGFRYVYDAKGRLVQRKQPGISPVFLVYDSRDRVVLIQDGNQRAAAAKYWTYIKYDASNRIVLTGIKDTTAVMSQTLMQATVDNFYKKSWTRLYEEYSGTAGIAHGYSNRSYPNVNTGAVLDVNRFLTVNYYDSYDFKTLWSGVYNYADDQLTATLDSQDDQGPRVCRQPSAEFPSVGGKLVGTKVKVLDGGIAGGYTWLRQVNYFDDKGRVVEVLSENYKGGIDRHSTLYDFVGNVLKERTTHQESDILKWKDVVGVSVIGNRITRASGTGWGSSGIASAESMAANTDGWIEFSASEENRSRFIGLSQANLDEDYKSIDYAFYLMDSKQLYIYENGTPRGSVAGGYKSGDILRIQREGSKIKYYRNGLDVSIPGYNQTPSTTALYVDIVIGGSPCSVVGMKASFSGKTQVSETRYHYNHIGNLTHVYHRLNDGAEILLANYIYNELGQLIDKRLHNIDGSSTYKQYLDYRYNIRGWLTNINDSKLSDGENDFFGMELGYEKEIQTGNSALVVTQDGLIGSYRFNGDASDSSPSKLDGSIVGTQLTSDNQGNGNSAYSFNDASYIQIPNSKSTHSFIQNTGKFTISAFLKLNDLSARSVIVSNSGTSNFKGFLFMYETYGGTAGDHQLRFTPSAGRSGVAPVHLGAKNTINDTNWHHVAVVGDGIYIRFYVDGKPDGSPSLITLKSDGDATYNTLIGKTMTSTGLVLGLNGAMDEVSVFNRPLNQREIQALAARISTGSTYSFNQYNGAITGVKWSVNMGLGETKEMGYNFDYDPLGRLRSATQVQPTSGESIEKWKNGNFHETDIRYDFNGNIQSLIRQNGAGDIIDQLTYNYGNSPLQGNQLLKVTDAADKFSGFVDIVSTSNDYAYDANGNQITDGNKGINTAITYNYLNLPELTVRSSGTLRNIYDASGSKLAQVVTFGGITKQIDYAGEFQYENDDLQLLEHREGRVVFAEPELVYSYDGSATDPVTPVNVSLTNVTGANGQTYIQATASSTTPQSGLFPIGGSFPVQAGERYRIRVRGYSAKGSAGAVSAAYIRAEANGVDLVWPGAMLQTASATEHWIEQIVTIPPGATELKTGVTWGTTLAGNIIYLNEFEVSRINNISPEYQYYIRDHQGNTRVTFTTKQEEHSSLATLEDNNEPSESGEFLNRDEAILLYSNLFDHTYNGPPRPNGPFGDPDAPADNGEAGYSTLLRGGPNETYGLAKTISVMPGDVVKMEVYAKYIDKNTREWQAPLEELMNQLEQGTAPAGTLIDGGAIGSIGGHMFPFVGLLKRTEDNETGPKAYLNWLIFDRDFNYLDGGFRRISQYGAIEDGSNGEHDLLEATQLITTPGFVYVYLSNENESTVDVFFDDFKVTHVEGPIVQMDDYYPFGLTFNHQLKENSVFEKGLFQGKEWVDPLELNLYDFQWRQYDPILGRTNVLDPHADMYADVSPYSFLNNNPVNTIDPTGMDVLGINDVGFDGLAYDYIAKCPSCPDTKEFRPFIDDPSRFYYYDPVTKTASLLLTAVEVSSIPPPNTSMASMALTGSILLAERTFEQRIAAELARILSGVLRGVKVSAGAAVMTVALVLTPAAGAGDGEMEILEKMNRDRILAEQAEREAAVLTKGGKQNIWPDQYGYPPTPANVDWKKSDQQLADEKSAAAGDTKKGPGTANNQAKKWFNNKRKEQQGKDRK